MQYYFDLLLLYVNCYHTNFVINSEDKMTIKTFIFIKF